MDKLNKVETEDRENDNEKIFCHLGEDIFEQEETRDEETVLLNREKYSEKYDNVIRTKDLTDEQKQTKHKDYVKQRRKRERDRKKLNKKKQKESGVT